MYNLFFKKFYSKIKYEVSKTLEEINLYNFLTYSALNSNTIGISEKNFNNDNIVVSLTSYSKRVEYVHVVIESLFQQSLKANKIILWLSELEFNINSIPQILKNLINRGLEVKFTKDIKSYKKLIPCLNIYKNSLIITVDDDIMYPVNTISKLYESYKKKPNSVHCNKAYKILFNKNNQILPYLKWEKNVVNIEPSFNYFPVGCGGVLYFPGCFYKDVSNESLFCDLAPSADDIWFKTMTLINKVKTCVTDDFKSNKEKLLYIPNSQEQRLYNNNKKNQNGNDFQLKKVFDYYKINKIDNVLIT